MNNDNGFADIPLGFGMALAKNQAAMSRFGMLSKDEQNAVIAGTHQIASKQDMQAYVQSLVE